MSGLKLSFTTSGKIVLTLDKHHNFLNISELYIIHQHNELIVNALHRLHSFLTANRSEAIRIAFQFCLFSHRSIAIVYFASRNATKQK